MPARMPHLSWPFFDDRHRGMSRQLRAWADAHVDADAGHDGDTDARCRELVRGLGADGWLRHVVVKPHGGLADRLDVRSLCLIRETLAWYSGLADFTFAMQGLGSGAISLFGSERLRKHYLNDVAAGSRIAAFALSEEAAGSNVAAIATTACKDGDGYVIDGAKTWISNAGIADFYVVFARTGEKPGAGGLSAFVVDADTPGLSVGARVDVIAPHPLGSLQFDECRVSENNIVGNAGDGFKVAMATLDVFRATVGAAALGFARRALAESIDRTRSRVVFGKPLAEFQLTRGKLADMAVDVDASALLVYRAAWEHDAGTGRVTREAAMAKLHATEAAQRVIDQAVQLFGGQGVVSGGVVERLYRDIRPLRIYEGTSEIQKLVIAKEVLKSEGEA